MCNVISFFLWFSIMFTNYLLLSIFQDDVPTANEGGKGADTSIKGGGDKDKV